MRTLLILLMAAMPAMAEQFRWTEPAGDPDWNIDENWADGVAPDASTTGVVVFTADGLAADGSVTNRIETDRTVGEFVLSPLPLEVIHHHTDLGGHRLVISDRIVLSTTQAGQTKSAVSNQIFSNGTLQIGAEGDPGSLFIGDFFSDRCTEGTLRIDPTATLEGYFNEIRVGRGKMLGRWDGRVTMAVLDLRDATVVGGVLKANVIEVKSSSSNLTWEMNSIRINDGTGLTAIEADQLLLGDGGGMDFHGDRFARLGNPNNGWKLPGGINVRVGRKAERVVGWRVVRIGDAEQVIDQVLTEPATVITGLENGREHVFAVVGVLSDGSLTPRSNTASVTPRATGEAKTARTRRGEKLTIGAFTVELRGDGARAVFPDGQELVYDGLRPADWKTRDGEHLVYPMPFGNGLDIGQFDKRGLPVVIPPEGLSRTDISSALSNRIPGGSEFWGIGFIQHPDTGQLIEQRGLPEIRENQDWVRKQIDGSWPVRTPYQWVPMSLASGWHDRVIWPALNTAAKLGYTAVLVDGGFGGMQGMDYGPMLAGRADAALPMQPFWWRFWRTLEHVGIRPYGECTMGWRGGNVFCGGTGDEQYPWMFQMGWYREKPATPRFLHQLHQLYNGTEFRSGDELLPVRRFAVEFNRRNPDPPDWIELVDLRQEDEIEITVRRREAPATSLIVTSGAEPEVKVKVRPRTWSDAVWHYEDGTSVVYPGYDEAD